MSLGQVDYVLLSRTPRPPQQGDVRLAWLNLNPIAVGSGRINRSRLYREQEYSRITAELAMSKANVRSNYSLDLHFVYAHLEAVHITERAPPLTQRRRRQAMRKPTAGFGSGYKRSRESGSKPSLSPSQREVGFHN